MNYYSKRFDVTVGCDFSWPEIGLGFRVNLKYGGYAELHLGPLALWVDAGGY